MGIILMISIKEALTMVIRNLKKTVTTLQMSRSQQNKADMDKCANKIITSHLTIKVERTQTRIKLATQGSNNPQAIATQVIMLFERQICQNTEKKSKLLLVEFLINNLFFALKNSITFHISKKSTRT